MSVRDPNPKQLTHTMANSKGKPADRTRAFATTLSQAGHSAVLTFGKTYTFRSGDTLYGYGIAKQLKMAHGFPQSLDWWVRELTEINRLSDPNRIFPGQQLQLPPLFSSPSPIVDSEGVSPAGSIDIPHPLTFVVKDEDEPFKPALHESSGESSGQGLPVSASEMGQQLPAGSFEEPCGLDGGP